MSDRFELLTELGSGGMGTVWKARDLETGDIVALKLLHRQFMADPEYVARFEREVELARRIDSPSVVRVFGFGRQDGVPYVAMEYVQGKSLRDVIRSEGPMAWEGPGRRIAIQLAEALAAAHAAGVVHRDVKPSNILLDAAGDAHLADFGIAGATDVTRLTGTLTVLGTPAYMAPDRTIDVRSDLYALGCVLFELLTGEPPFVGETQQQVLLAHLRDSPNLSRLPVGARRVVGWLLEKEPGKRPTSAHVLLAALRGTSSPPRAFAAAFSRRWAVAGALSVASLGIAGFAAASWVVGGGEQPPATPTVRATSEAGTTRDPTEPRSVTAVPTSQRTIQPTSEPSSPAATTESPATPTVALPSPRSGSPQVPTPPASSIPGTLAFEDPDGAWPVPGDVVICWDAQPLGAKFTITITRIAPTEGQPVTFEFTDTAEGPVNCSFAVTTWDDTPFVEFQLSATNAAGVTVASQTNRYSTYAIGEPTPQGGDWCPGLDGQWLNGCPEPEPPFLGYQITSPTSFRLIVEEIPYAALAQPSIEVFLDGSQIFTSARNYSVGDEGWQSDIYEYTDGNFQKRLIEPNTTYCLYLKIVYQGGRAIITDEKCLTTLPR